MRLPLLLFFLSVCTAPLSAQESPVLRVTGKAERDPGAVIAKNKYDANKVQVAGIRVLTDLDGLKFDSPNGVVDLISTTGEYVVFLSPTERKLTVRATGFLPLELILADAGIKLKSGEMWKVNVTGDRKREIVAVNFLIKPSDSGVEVMIDDKPAATIRNLPLPVGSHKIRIVKNGFSTIEKTFEVTAEKALFEFLMTEVSLQTITVRSEPKGAIILLDGVEKGKTDRQLFVYPGKYSLRWVHAEYLDSEQTIEVLENGANEFGATLIKNTGFVGWEVFPPDAVIRINGQEASSKPSEPGAETATGLAERGPGTYTLSVERSGYLPATETVIIERGRTITRKIALEKSTGTVSWEMAPANASVLINKEAFTNRTSADLAPGKYLVELSLEGYEPFSESFEIKRGEQIQRVWKLIRQTGDLQFVVDPIDARVQLMQSGKVLDRWTGAKIAKNLPAGSYSLRAEMSGYEAKSIDFAIASGKTEAIELVLKQGTTFGTVDGAPLAGVLTNSIGMELILIPAGSFFMGSADSKDEKPVHKVTISKPFYMGRYEVTQKEWKTLMGNNPSAFQGDSRPVEKVSWNLAVEFIQKLNEKEGTTKYRLPTEAEWEYVAKPDSSARWTFGTDQKLLTQYAWFDNNSMKQTNRVGQKSPNVFGLHDIHGNVWEWVQDWYGSGYYAVSPPVDPSGPASGNQKVYRGGSWDSYPLYTRNSFRGSMVPLLRNSMIGFRIVREVD